MNLLTQFNPQFLNSPNLWASRPAREPSEANTWNAAGAVRIPVRLPSRYLQWSFLSALWQNRRWPLAPLHGCRGFAPVPTQASSWNHGPRGTLMQPCRKMSTGKKVHHAPVVSGRREGSASSFDYAIALSAETANLHGILHLATAEHAIRAPVVGDVAAVVVSF